MKLFLKCNHTVLFLFVLLAIAMTRLLMRTLRELDLKCNILNLH